MAIPFVTLVESPFTGSDSPQEESSVLVHFPPPGSPPEPSFVPVVSPAFISTLLVLEVIRTFLIF